MHILTYLVISLMFRLSRPTKSTDFFPKKSKSLHRSPSCTPLVAAQFLGSLEVTAPAVFSEKRRLMSRFEFQQQGRTILDAVLSWTASISVYVFWGIFWGSHTLLSFDHCRYSLKFDGFSLYKCQYGKGWPQPTLQCFFYPKIMDDDDNDHLDNNYFFNCLG